MILKEKLKAYLLTRKTPMTAEMIVARFGCSNATAVKVMSQLIKEGAVREMLVASNKRYVRGVLI